jgi:hypothetical protein
MRRLGAASPDRWDAVALTFAEPVADRLPGWSRRRVYPDLGGGVRALRARKRSMTRSVLRPYRLFVALAPLVRAAI